MTRPAKHEPHPAHRSRSQQTPSDLPRNAGANEGPGKRIYFVVVTLVKNSCGDAVSQNLGTYDRKRPPRLLRHRRIRELLPMYRPCPYE